MRARPINSAHPRNGNFGRTPRGKARQRQRIVRLNFAANPGCARNLNHLVLSPRHWSAIALKGKNRVIGGGDRRGTVSLSLYESIRRDVEREEGPIRRNIFSAVDGGAHS